MSLYHRAYGTPRYITCYVREGDKPHLNVLKQVALAEKPLPLVSYPSEHKEAPQRDWKSSLRPAVLPVCRRGPGAVRSLLSLGSSACKAGPQLLALWDPGCRVGVPTTPQLIKGAHFARVLCTNTTSIPSGSLVFWNLLSKGSLCDQPPIRNLGCWFLVSFLHGQADARARNV